jgi:hypothetical protein
VRPFDRFNLLSFHDAEGSGHPPKCQQSEERDQRQKGSQSSVASALPLECFAPPAFPRPAEGSPPRLVNRRNLYRSAKCDLGLLVPGVRLTNRTSAKHVSSLCTGILGP